MDENVCGTFLTGSKILSLLLASPKAHVKGHELQNVEATVIGDAAGYSSKVMRVHLKWSTETTPGPQPPQSIIIKVIGNQSIGDIFKSMSAEEVAKLNKQMSEMHGVECSVYELEEFPEAMRLPICYFTSRSTDDQAGMIGLEDLGDRGVIIPATEVGIGFNKAQLDQMLDAFTTQHAWSVNTSVDWRRTIPLYEQLEGMKTFFDQFAAMYEKSKEAYPRAYENVNEEKLRAYLKFENFRKVFGCDPKAKYGLPVVLVHGDVHFVNTVWERREDGTAGDRLVAMIDWQVSHQGCGMEDLARMMVLSLSIETRRSYKEYILEQYVEQFNKKVHKEEHRIRYENAKRALDDFCAYTAVMWGCNLLIHGNFAKQLKNTSEEERNVIANRIVDCIIDAFRDARDILGF